MIEHNLTIDFDLNVNTVSDCLPADTFDVSALKKESPDGPVLDLAPGDGDRPRTKFTKTLTFIALNDACTEFKRAGRGRGKSGEVRMTFDIHHTHVDTVSAGVWTLDALTAFKAE